MWLKKRIAVLAVASLAGSVGAVAVGLPANATTTSAAVTTTAPAAGPIKVKFFWSAVLRLFITISNHAAQQMVARNVSQTLLKQILNEGTKTTRNGVAYVRLGNYEARVNASTGNVITVVKLSGGGGGGGGV